MCLPAPVTRDPAPVTGHLTPDPFEEWRALTAAVPPGVVRLVLADVDGVVTPGEGHPADLEVLAALARCNRECRRDPAVPAVTLCTGRPAPYVEALAQAIGSFLPSIFEQGCGLFEPRSFRYLFHPALPEHYAARLAAFRAALDAPLLRPGRAFVQPGKEASMTLYPLGDTTLDAIVAVAAEISAALGGLFDIQANITGVEARPPGFDKGVGARWLAELLDLDFATCVAGVGDSDPDLAFLRLVAYPAAPSNATPAVQAFAADVAAAPDGHGLLEIIRRIVARNRSALV